MLNSTLCGYLFRYYIYSFDETGYKIFTEYLQHIPLPIATEEIMKKMKKRYRENGIKVSEVDELIYSIYKFTQDEIFEIKNSINLHFWGN